MPFFPDNLFLLVVLILFTWVCFRNLKYGIYAIIFLMLTYLWRTEIFSIPTTLLELMIYVLFLVWLASKINFSYFKTSPCPLLRNEGKIPLTLPYQARDRIFYKRGITISNIQYPILTLGIALLFLGLTISTATSADLKTSAGIFKGWFVDPFLFFLVLINVIKTKKQIGNLFGAWALSGLAVAAISLVYLITGDLTYDDRLKAFFLSPNHLAMYLAPAFLIVLFFLLNRREYKLKKLEIGNWMLKLERYFGVRALARICAKPLSFVFGLKPSLQYPIFCVIILIPLYFTFSYGAFLGIAAAIFYFIFVLFRRRIVLKYKLLLRGARANPEQSGFARRRRGNLPAIIPRIMARDCRAPFRYRSTPLAMTVVIILCLFILSSLLFLSSDKFQQITDSKNRSSFHSRLMIWNASKEILKDNFVFGIGPGTFQDAYLDYAGRFDELYLEWAVPQPHNIFLAFWLQTGIIGLLGFILILIWFFSGIQIPLTPFNKGGIKFPISHFPIILMIYFLVHGLTDTTYWKNDLSLMFWILIGTMVVCRNIQKSSIRE